MSYFLYGFDYEQGIAGKYFGSINTVLRPTFELAVRDDIIRRNPVDGAYAEVKKEMVVLERVEEH